MKYRKLKNGKYKIIDMNIITYAEVVMKYFNQNVSMETILKENEFYDEYYKCIICLCIYNKTNCSRYSQ